MPDQDDAAPPFGGEEDPALAADRLERALERIAASVTRAAAGRRAAAESIADPAAVHEVAARLDALIVQLRTALGRD